MRKHLKGSAWVLALGLIIGLIGLGALVSNAALQIKQYERTVTVKGLAEQELPADIIIWPIQFTLASNDLAKLYEQAEQSTQKIRAFLLLNGLKEDEISVAPPSIHDKSAQNYGNNNTQYRYTATQTVTVYSPQIDLTRGLMPRMSELGKQGIVITGDDYQARTEYIFNRLNEIKPEMIERATQNARAVALKFADDSNSELGKIKRASQGSFSISARDKNNPHIKKIRVVSTIEYYLSD
ncbi:SIMPL domain-containing protein [Catenovulum sp. 2E275]|uniref:SIMPL domain-containing protein n=1 Tax=Catenovulum sp. 2E275 TaxID=2980497 RepID=UPI0021D13000|nr:SIMPL domain-containing protein [Catenovulum sp. 2E275]MCU4675852.1 SIMPL domain-containing protein [Catenovulum sp. 2E275]